MTAAKLDPERLRLEEDVQRSKNWKRWGPYLSERQWGTVREDYSPHGSAWDSFPHEQARSRAYRWGEDGLMGLSDRHQYVCFAVALWNGKDPILKERLFGLTGSQGNHGEDVKECYYYLDSTPTHSYMKALYKYPQREFPYQWLLDENRRRARQDPEFELVDTGIFDDDRYFDVFTEYAKASPDDVLIRIRVFNRGPEEATVILLSRVAGFHLRWVWYLSVGSVWTQAIANLLVLRREFGRKLNFASATAQPAAGTSSRSPERRCSIRTERTTRPTKSSPSAPRPVRSGRRQAMMRPAI